MSALREYPKYGVEFKIVTQQDKGKIGDEYNVLLPHNSFINIIKNIFRVRRLARGFDVIHAYDVWPYGIYGYFAVFGTRKKLFMLGIATYSLAPVGFSLKRLAMNLAYSKAKRVHCVSDYTEMRIKERSPQAKTEVVHFGHTKLPNVSDQFVEEVRKRYGITKEMNPILISVGAIKYRKGQFDTARASAYLNKEYPNYRYLVIGDDSNKEYVGKIKDFARENGVSENIKILHDVNDDKTLTALYKMADVFCLNSNNDGDHFEGFGQVFFEAGQLGVPSVGSSGCGIEDAIKDGYSGYLTKQGDSKDIYEKIYQILKGDREKFSKQAREWALSFTWEETARQYTREYDS